MGQAIPTHVRDVTQIGTGAQVEEEAEAWLQALTQWGHSPSWCPCLAALESLGSCWAHSLSAQGSLLAGVGHPCQWNSDATGHSGGIAFLGPMTQYFLPPSPLTPGPLCSTETGPDPQAWTIAWLSGPLSPGVWSKRGPLPSRPQFALQGCESALQPWSRALTLLAMTTKLAKWTQYLSSL